VKTPRLFSPATARRLSARQFHLAGYWDSHIPQDHLLSRKSGLPRVGRLARSGLVTGSSPVALRKARPNTGIVAKWADLARGVWGEKAFRQVSSSVGPVPTGIKSSVGPVPTGLKRCQKS